MSSKQLLGFLGAAMLIAGSLVPLVAIPRYGQPSLLDYSPIVAGVVILLGVAAAYYTLMRSYRHDMYLSVLSVFVYVFLFLRHKLWAMDATAEVHSRYIFGNIYITMDLSPLTIANMGLAWGWLLLAGGTLCLLLAYVLRLSDEPHEELIMTSADRERIEELFENATRHAEQGENRQAIEALDKILFIDPENTEAMTQRGFHHLILGEDEQGLHDLRRAARRGDLKAREHLGSQGLDW
jgi:hypothetical protein